MAWVLRVVLHCFDGLHVRCGYRDHDEINRAPSNVSIVVDRCQGECKTGEYQVKHTAPNFGEKQIAEFQRTGDRQTGLFTENMGTWGLPAWY